MKLTLMKWSFCYNIQTNDTAKATFQYPFVKTVLYHKLACLHHKRIRTWYLLLREKRKYVLKVLNHHYHHYRYFFPSLIDTLKIQIIVDTQNMLILTKLILVSVQILVPKIVKKKKNSQWHTWL